MCEELFRDIDKDTVDFVDNYDATTTEPTLLPVTFPTILANNTLGIAVGMASSICSFNLAELCETTIALLKDPQHDIKATMPAPDFVGGGYILYNEKEIDNIYETGRGSVRVRAKYDYQRDGNMLEIRQIPPTTTVEAVMDKIAELVKAGRMLLVHSAQIPEKQTKNTAGVNVLTLKKNQHITGVRLAAGLELADAHRYRVRTLPAMGALVRAEDAVEQTSLL